MESFYPHILLAFLLFYLLVYLVLDGLDLGLGIVTLFTKNPQERHTITTLIAPLWDGNEVWLVVASGLFFGAFPLAYSLVIPTLYLPLTMVVFSLIVRAVALEFSYQDVARAVFWQTLFGVGSLLAALFLLATLSHLFLGYAFLSPATVFVTLIALALMVVHGLAYATPKAALPTWSRYTQVFRRLPCPPFVATSFLVMLFWGGLVASIKSSAHFGYSLQQASAPLTTLRPLLYLTLVLTPLLLFFTRMVYKIFRTTPSTHS